MAATSTTGTITSAGIGSGIDVNGIVSALVNVERQPITQLQTQASALQAKLSSYGQVQSYVSAVRDAARTLASPGTWNQTSGSSSDAASVGVTTDGSTLPGSYNVAVQNVASSLSLVTAISYANATASLGQGTLHIELGDWTVSPPVPKPNASPVDIVIGPGENSLQKVADKINASNAGVVASILNDGSGARLVLRSRDTGAVSGFKVSVSEDAAAPGLSALAYDPSAGATSHMTRTQAAADAHATLNGVAISSPTNTLANVIDGLTLTLGKATTSPVAVSVTSDTDAMKKAVNSFVSAYNNLAKYLTDQTKYDDANKKAGALQGDSGALAVRSQLRSMLSTTSSASSVFTRLSDVGFDIQADGTIALKSAKLDNALANVGELKKFFTQADAAVPANNGVMTQLRQLADGFLGTDGVITTRSAGLQQRVQDNKDQQARLEDRVSAYRARVQAQYTALDQQMGQLSGLSTYVTQQLALLNRNT